MDESKIQDKVKMKEILNEIANLKKYSNELSSNTRGEKLENYINELKNKITILNNEAEEAYDNTFKINN